MNESDYQAYYLEKMYAKFIFDSEFNQNENNFLDIEFFKNFKNVVIDYQNQSLLDNKTKENLYNLVNKLRYIEDDNRVVRINYVNEIIYSLNQSYDYKKNYMFYIEQQLIRNHIIFGEINDYIEVDKDLVITSLSRDAEILFTHSDSLSEEEFSELLPDIATDGFYFYSINAFINEFPQIFTNKIFYHRFQTVIKFIKENDLDGHSLKNVAGFDDYNNILIKRINEVRNII